MLVFAATACTELTVVQLRGPDVPANTPAMLLLVVKKNEPPEVWAFDFDRSDTRLLSLPADTDFELYALMLECPLSALALEEGQLALAEDGRKLPQSPAAFGSVYV